MPRKYRRVQFPIILATALVLGIGIAAVVAIKHTANPDYWLAAGGALVPLVLAVAGKILRPVVRYSTETLNEQLKDLRELVLEQWESEIELRITVYPLPVPFSEADRVTAPIPSPVKSDPKRTVDRPVTVMDDWSAILRSPDRTAPSLDGDFESIARVFRAEGLGNRMVVLGSPGSGKTVLAQWLTVRLLKPDQDGEASSGVAPAELVPVLLPLSTWDPAVELNDWAAAQMVNTYPWLAEEIQVRGGGGRTLAGQLLDQRRVLMVLDGLDEITPKNRVRAFKKLAVAAQRNQPMVVTCRTMDYAQIVFEAGKTPLPRTPVIKLDPLPLEAVRTYLTRADDPYAPRFRVLLDKIEADRDGPLVKTLCSPFALWLVTTVYQSEDSDPAEIADCPDPREILRHLLEGLIPAVYTATVRDRPGVEEPEVVERIQDRLVDLAEYLGPDLEQQNIDWWRLPRRAPKAFVGGIVGSVVGGVLGVAVGLAAAARFGERTGLLMGVVFGIVAGVLSGITSVRPQDNPRAVELRLRFDYWRFVGCLTVGVAVGLTSAYADHRGGGLVAGLITAAAVGPVCAVPCIIAFDWMPGITAGIAAALALGLASGLSEGNGHPLWSGLAAGAVFACSAWVFVGLFQPAKDRLVVNPQSLFDRDRAGSLIVAGTAGIAFGVAYGVALGLVFAVVALIALTIAVALTVSMWGAFGVSRIWLAAKGVLPLSIMAFFEEAYDRGVLRQVGGSYQFRHAELKEALIALRSRHDPAAVPAQAAQPPQAAAGSGASPDPSEGVAAAAESA